LYNAVMKLNARELRDADEGDIKETLKKVKRRPIYFILENIYDTYNIGGLFRLADALAIEKMYICGQSETPPNARIKKASIGTYKVVPWEYKRSSKEAIDELRKLEIRNLKSETNSNFENSKIVSSFDIRTSNLKKVQIIAVEQDKRAIAYQKADLSMPVALVLGNETYGVTAETLKLCDQIVEIPMWGINKSLNVIVSAAIVSYWAVTKAR
jgi:23S rRNA (guanosine2251-2'-O)-methyltransferase